jgi:glycosyltransferase involved in cell wall biosynthesis
MENYPTQIPLRILVLTRSYPAAGDLYQYPFVHRRVLAYRAAGHEVAVFRVRPGLPATHEFDGVACHSGDPAAFGLLAKNWNADVIAAHGLSEAMWPALREAPRIPVRAWLHGSEIPGFFRQKALALPDPVARASAIEDVETRARFWRRLLADLPENFELVFPSRSAVDLARQDLHDCLGNDSFSIIPNPIDADLFAYSVKGPEHRFSILSIRPYDSSTYANDLAVSAVLHLSKRPDFDRLSFTFIGDGPLFEQTLEPISRLPNVAIRRGFLTQAEIAHEHSRHGIFLVPTRLDTHGVSRDEAMASGLVPVTSALPVVLEFVDENCAGVAGPEDSYGLAQEIARMVDDPALFLRRSKAAADRILRDRSHQKIIPAELALLSSEAALV